MRFRDLIETLEEMGSVQIDHEAEQDTVLSGSYSATCPDMKEIPCVLYERDIANFKSNAG